MPRARRSRQVEMSCVKLAPSANLVALNLSHLSTLLGLAHNIAYQSLQRIFFHVHVLTFTGSSGLLLKANKASLEV